MEARAPDFRTFYDEFAPRIRRYLSRLVGECEAEDLTREVFARAHSAMGTRRGDSLVSTWLYRIATNAAIDRLRAASRREVPVTAPAESVEACLSWLLCRERSLLLGFSQCAVGFRLKPGPFS